MQAVPLSTRKATGGSSEGIAPFLQLPHISETVVKKLARKVCQNSLLAFLSAKFNYLNAPA